MRPFLPKFVLAYKNSPSALFHKSEMKQYFKSMAIENISTKIFTNLLQYYVSK